jgi:hypothetical protein
MNDITYIVPSKNDGYDPQNLDKVILSINTNVGQLLNAGLSVEPILLDWGSNVPFYILDRIKNEVKIPIQHLYVDKSVFAADGLNPERYYEYFAKNVGIRRSRGKYILIENSDIINDESLAASIHQFVKTGFTGVYGRPSMRVNVLYPNIDEYTHYNTINDRPMGDLNPGDFMLVPKDDWLRVGGYDETNSGHRGIKRQTNMDVEMLCQLNRLGISVYFLDGYYRHMDHDRGGLTTEQQFGTSANTRNLNGYTNRETWGYTGAKIIKLSDAATKLYL